MTCQEPLHVFACRLHLPPPVPFSAAQIALPSCCNFVWHLPGYHLAHTLSLMIPHVSSTIHELWCANRFSGFGTVILNLENILSSRVLI